MAATPPRDLDFADSAPVKAEASRVITARPTEVWAVLVDHRSWPRWFGPSLLSVEPTSTPEHGVGSTRRVRVRGGLTVTERFVAWDEPAVWAFTATDVKPRVFSALVERITLDRVDEVSTRVTYRQAFSLPPLLRPVAPLLRRGLSRSLGPALDGLDREVVERR